MADVGLMGLWPLPDNRHYYAPDAPSPFVHSGLDPVDTSAVLLIQAKVGALGTGLYDEDTASQVMAWRRHRGAEEGDHVDEALWLWMDTVPDPVPTTNDEGEVIA